MVDEKKSENSVSAPPSPAAAPASTDVYRVLARKYRPNNVDELIGQESLVKTLSNALEMGRLAHAFILTGLRGIGKTTTARIIAKGLNCVGADGKGAPSLNPCGVCAHCLDIAEGRHVDVLEMDAASNTGVDDVRDIIDGVHYAPLAARFKIYIIDEVHMLSKNAFNALLKTLEEPPAAVKFVFATTEIRKVPVTVLSRCQRFDLRRVPTDMLMAHLKTIADKESITIDDAALLRLARAAEGSVRDALSLLDQAAALTSDAIDDASVAAMLGQAGRMEAIAIVGAVLGGDAKGAMDGLDAAVKSGAEPVMVIADMLDFVHLASRQAAGGGASDMAEAESEALAKIADDTPLSHLARAWQILLKGHGEVMRAPDPRAAADMVLIRLAYAANLPTPSEVVKKLAGTPAPASTPASTPTPQPATPPAPAESSPESSAESPPPESPPTSISAMAELFSARGEMILAGQLTTRIKPITLESGRFIFSADPPFEPAVPKKIGACLRQWTGMAWEVEMVAEGGEATLDEQANQAADAVRQKFAEEPIVKAALEKFDGAKIHSITPLSDTPENDGGDDGGNDEADDDVAADDAKVEHA